MEKRPVTVLTRRFYTHFIAVFDPLFYLFLTISWTNKPQQPKKPEISKSREGLQTKHQGNSLDEEKIYRVLWSFFDDFQKKKSNHPELGTTQKHRFLKFYIYDKIQRMGKAAQSPAPSHFFDNYLGDTSCGGRKSPFLKPRFLGPFFTRRWELAGSHWERIDFLKKPNFFIAKID